MKLFNGDLTTHAIPETTRIPENHMDCVAETDIWKNSIEQSEDSGKWIDNIELHDNPAQWQNDIGLDEYSSTFDEAESTVMSVEKNESDTEISDLAVKSISEKLGTADGIIGLIEAHPEKAELWKSQLEAIKVLGNPDASPVEIRSAQSKLSALKGQLMEFAARDILTEVGFDVETQQKLVEGENGGTKPDVVAVNNTGIPQNIFGTVIKPGETISIECKCGGTAYITNQLNTHIPNQLSGQEGTKVLLATSDIRETPDRLALNVCEKYDAILVSLDISVMDVENAIKEVNQN